MNQKLCQKAAKGKLTHPMVMQSSPKMFNKILFWNFLNGLLSKIAFVKDLIQLHCPYFFISESELRNVENVNACYIQGYTLHLSRGFELGKSRKCCYLLDGTDFERKSQFESLELILFESKCFKLRVGRFYRLFTPPPGKTIKELDQELFSCIAKASATNYSYI
jgi:hypothetical protein